MRIHISAMLAIALLIFCLLPVTSRAGFDEAAVRASTSQRVHPLLIGNDHNSLLEITIDVNASDVRVESFTMSLSGCDDVRDVGSLELFYSALRHPRELDRIRSGISFSGDRDALRRELIGNPFGKMITPANTITFRDSQRLQKGRNIFWLSCRMRPDADLGNKVDAACVTIETSAGTITPDDESLGIRKRIGIALRKHNDDDVHTSRIPVLAATPKGTLLCAYDLRRTKRRDLQEDIDIGLSRSIDGGQTWEPLQVIMDMGEYGGLGQNRNGCSDPGLVVDQNTGTIFCAAVWMWGKLGEHQWKGKGSEAGFEIGRSAQFLIVRSDDDGVTWTKPENMTRRLKNEDWILLAPSPQAGITLKDGTLVMPGEGRDEQDRKFSTLIVSRDHGETWVTGSSAAHGNSECQPVQLNDGSILLNARTGRSTKYRSVWTTKDLGITWQPHPTHRRSLIEPNCNGSLIRFEGHRTAETRPVLLFANPRSETGRDHHSIQVSFDEGSTWSPESGLLLDEGQGNGYPSMATIDNRHVGIVYEGSQAHLVFEKLSIDDLLPDVP